MLTENETEREVVCVLSNGRLNVKLSSLKILVPSMCKTDDWKKENFTFRVKHNIDSATFSAMLKYSEKKPEDVSVSDWDLFFKDTKIEVCDFVRCVYFFENSNLLSLLEAKIQSMVITFVFFSKRPCQTKLFKGSPNKSTLGKVLFGSEPETLKLGKPKYFSQTLANHDLVEYKDWLLEVLQNVNVENAVYVYYESNLDPSIEVFLSWLDEYHLISMLPNSNDEEKKIREKFLRYILRKYHYNAPFSLEEIIQLDYQTSPLLDGENRYVRTSNVWFNYLANSSGTVLLDCENAKLFIDDFYSSSMPSFECRKCFKDLVSGNFKEIKQKETKNTIKISDEDKKLIKGLNSFVGYIGYKPNPLDIIDELIKSNRAVNVANNLAKKKKTYQDPNFSDNIKKILLQYNKDLEKELKNQKQKKEINCGKFLPDNGIDKVGLQLLKHFASSNEKYVAHLDKFLLISEVHDELFNSLISKMKEQLKMYCDSSSELHLCLIKYLFNNKLKEYTNILQNYNSNKIHKLIMAVQEMVEVWLLLMDFFPLQKEEVKKIFVDTSSYLENIQPIVHFTPYAMRSFIRPIQATKSMFINEKKIQSPVQLYFELLLTLNVMKNNTSIYISQTDEDIQDCNIYFFDIHPNNATETALFSRDLVKICKNIKKYDKNRLRLLVVDVTLNSAEDEEIQKFLKECKDMIQSGEWCVLLVKSLTKLMQFGFDILNGGLLLIYNCGDNWKEFNDLLQKLEEEEPLHPLSQQYFANLLKHGGNLLDCYIKLINKNTVKLYDKILNLYKTLEIPYDKKLIDLTCNTDEKSCYIALNCEKYFIDNIEMLDEGKICKFVADIIDFLIIPLSWYLNLPLTQRMSIGFPLSSINECFYAIRLTVGLEEDQLLSDYALVMAYTCFVLNRAHSSEKLIEENYRRSFLREKVDIFKAAYPIPGCQSLPSITITQDNRTYHIQNGKLTILYKANNIINQCEEDKISFSGGGNLCGLDKKKKIFIYSCLSNLDPSVNVQLDCLDNSFSFESFKYIYVPPFVCVVGDIKFTMTKEGKFFATVNNDENKVLNAEKILIKKGSRKTKASLMDANELIKVFDKLPYTLNNLGEKIVDPVYIGASIDSENKLLELEYCKRVLSLSNFSIYARKTKDRIELELDFWGIKNPVEKHVKYDKLYKELSQKYNIEKAKGYFCVLITEEMNINKMNEILDLVKNVVDETEFNSDSNSLELTFQNFVTQSSLNPILEKKDTASEQEEENLQHYLKGSGNCQTNEDFEPTRYVDQFVAYALGENAENRKIADALEKAGYDRLGAIQNLNYEDIHNIDIAYGSRLPIPIVKKLMFASGYIIGTFNQAIN
ncbi:hypothetical protein ABK040_002724 [Willaertia magna]